MKRPPYTLYPLGDQAVTVELPGGIDPVSNSRLLAWRAALQKRNLTGLLDVVVAYNTLTVYFDPALIHRHVKPFSTAGRWIEDRLRETFNETTESARPAGRRIIVPVCYDPLLAIDLRRVADLLQCTENEIIKLHSSSWYRVYMVGFLPGFPYLGELPPELHLNRKSSPVPVAAGSVAIAGRQTGIYPFASPGGWHVIGRTPLRLFNAHADPPVLFQPGDEVQFQAITRAEYERLLL